MSVVVGGLFLPPPEFYEKDVTRTAPIPNLNAFLSRLSVEEAGAFAAGLSRGLGESVSFEYVIQQFFALYAKLRGIGAIAAQKMAFQQFSAAAQAADAQLKSTQLSSGLTLAFSAFGVALGGFYLGKGAYQFMHRDKAGGGASGGGRGSGASGSTDGAENVKPDVLSTLSKAALGNDRNSQRSSDTRHSGPQRHDTTRSSRDLNRDTENSSSDNSKRDEQSAVPLVDSTPGGGAAHQSMNNGEVMQIVNGVIMYLFPSVGQAVGSLAGAADQHSSDLLKAAAEQFSLLRDLASKSEEAASQGISSIAQAWQQSPN